MVIPATTKLIHHGEVSHVDLNRAGTPLLEIVTEPDIRTPKDAAALYASLEREHPVHPPTDCSGCHR